MQGKGTRRLLNGATAALLVMFAGSGPVACAGNGAGAQAQSPADEGAASSGAAGVEVRTGGDAAGSQGPGAPGQGAPGQGAVEQSAAHDKSAASDGAAGRTQEGDEDTRGPVAKFFARRGLVSECNDLIEAINQEQDTIRNSETHNATAMRHLADKLDGVVDKVRQISVDDAELDQHKERYIELIRDFGKVARRTADAMEAKDLEQLQQAQVALKKIGPRETVIVDDLNSYCQGG